MSSWTRSTTTWTWRGSLQNMTTLPLVFMRPQNRTLMQHGLDSKPLKIVHKNPLLDLLWTLSVLNQLLTLPLVLTTLPQHKAKELLTAPTTLLFMDATNFVHKPIDSVLFG